MYPRARFDASVFFAPMQTKVCLFVALLSSASLCAQSKTPPSAPPQVLKESAYVRRFSLGATLSVLVLPSVRNGSENVVTTSPATDGLYATTEASKRVGFGVIAQVAITERFAVAGNVLVRKVGYKKNSDIYQGVDNPLTSKDERTYTVLNEDTRARHLDIPVVVRYYTKDRHMSGPRGFVEGGAAVRRVSKISTATDKSVNSGDTVCCDNTPATPASRAVRGLVAGAGFQLIDGVGVRVVPEVRYTRWMGETFKSPSTATQRNQIEAMISLTF